jgi:hypothetical protein
MAASNLKNTWLNNDKPQQMLENLDEHLMNGWASEVTLGQLINSLPNELRDFFLDMKFKAPIENSDGFEITFTVEN